MNRDIILREHLAIERTKLANESTLLAYVRTGLYFVIAGSTLGHLVDTLFWRLAGYPLVAIGLIIVVAGINRYRKVKKAIESSRINIGNSTDEFIKAVRGT